MRKEEISFRLTEHHALFCKLADELSEGDFMFAPENKWTAGQQLEHIYLSVRPLKLLFMLPKLLIRAWFGRANRPSRTYEALVEKYITKLAAGYQANSVFLPKPVAYQEKAVIIGKLKSAVSFMVKKLGGFTEDQLDTLIVPHPLLGKLTLREMMYFTIYHVEHHQALMLGNLKGQKKR